MDKMKIALLWHMHQPSYVKENRLFLPWVFLHSIKDYYDMPYIASKFKAKVTFNLTPTLLEQILMYEDVKNDEFLSLMLKRVDNLTLGEEKFLLKILKSGNYETMIKPYERYDCLYKKDTLSTQEFLDLEVWFLLSWCGNFLKETSFIKNYLQKESFSEDEKKELVFYLTDFVKGIIPFYKKLFKEKLIDLTTTPFYHPIMPLLIDMNTAKKANPNTSLPKGFFSLKDDAVKHIKKAKELFKELFEEYPTAFWPSEGGVDEESVLLYKEFEIKRVFSDEAVLKKSGFNDITKAYEYEGVEIYFRDHTLSDLIGFTYKNFEAKNAVKDFKSRLKDFNVVILDGENAWEYYKNNGKDFLEEFYKEFKDNFVFFGNQKTVSLKHLEPGSWIYGDFNTWVGDEEKNRAWELLFDTKRDCLREGFNKDAEEELLKAEGSDWFWWYGKGHFTEYAKEFDSLFREHLKNVYKLINFPYPKVLDEPITGSKELKNILSEPKDYIYPVIDGKVTSFFEWIDAGVLYEGGGTMQANDNIKYLYWGENEEKFFLRLDGERVNEYEYKVFFEDKELKVNCKKGEIVEIEIDKKEFEKKEGVLRIEVLKNNKIIQILPSTTRLYIKINSDYARNWYV